jgi:multidrug transporter EmrE-like cation transporter
MCMERPSGVTAISILFFVVGAHLAGLGAVMLISPGLVSMAAGAPFLGGLELAGPYMFLLAAALAAVLGLGLLRLNNWARRGAIAVAFAGLVMLIPSVSDAAVGIHLGELIWSGLGIIVRMVVIWYLWQTPVAEQFTKPSKST